MSAFGPLFRHELTRLARRGLQPKLRAAFAGLLLAALLVTYLQSFPGASAAGVLTSIGEPLTIEAAANFAERFLVSFLVAQLLVVCVVTPVVAGGAIAEERDRGTLDFLLSSPLSNAEIVLGKMAARLAFMVGLLLTGLPVLVLTMFFGGVDGAQFLAGYAITLATVFSVGSLSLWLVVRGDTLGAVLLRVYLWQIGLAVFGFCCGCCRAPVFVSPFATLIVLVMGWEDFMMGTIRADIWLLVGGYAALHLLLGTWWLARAVDRVRRSPVEARQNQWPPDAYNPPRDDDLPPLAFQQLPTTPGATATFAFPLRDDDPFAWKERWFGRRILPRFDAQAAGGLFMMTVAGLMLACGLWVTTTAGDSPVFHAMFAAPLAVVLLCAGGQACGSVAGERRAGTLVSLLMVPAERRAILWTKARRAAVAWWPAYTGAGVLLVAALATSGLSPIAVVTLPLTFAGWLVFVVGVGMRLSVRSPSPGRASGTLLAWLMGLSLFPPLLAPLFGYAEFFVDGLSPVVGLWRAAPTALGWVAVDHLGAFRALGAVVGALAAGVVGVVCWESAVRRFETIGE